MFVFKLLHLFETNVYFKNDNMSFFLFYFQEEIDIEMSSSDEAHTKSLVEAASAVSGIVGAHIKLENTDPKQNLLQLITRQAKFLELLRDVKTVNFLVATCHLCHMDTQLAQHLWLQLFPRIWKILNEKQQNVSNQIKSLNACSIVGPIHSS